MNDYERKQEERRERLERASDVASRASGAAFKRSHAITDGIPLGQPILVGHHSEKRHRAALRRSDSAMRRGIEEADRAKELARRAASVGSGGISSDDSDAIQKLEAQAAEIETVCERWGAYRKALRGIPLEDLAAAFKRLEIPKEDQLEMARNVQFSAQGEPVPAWLNTNRRANLRRIRKRIEDLRALEVRPTIEPIQGEGWRIEEDAGENRLRIFFEKIPAEALRKALKSHGFRWSPTVGAWQRHRSTQALWAARHVIGQS